MIVIIDPADDSAQSTQVTFLTNEEAIRRMQASHPGGPALDPAWCLREYKVGSSAENLFDVIERMGKAMFMDTYQVGPERWPDAEQASWRTQARAAIKALGVVLPS